MEPHTTVARDAAGAGVASLPGKPLADEPATHQPDGEGFDPAKLEASSWKSPIVEWLLSYPRCLIGLLRFFTPVLQIRFLRWAFVLRYDEVREVLSHDQAFAVDWGGKMIEVTGGKNAGGKNFVLGMERGDEYRLSYTQLAAVFPRADVPQYVERRSAEIAAEILERKKLENKSEFDAVEELITAVPTRLCEDYYGIAIPDKVLFAKWTLATSSYVFGPPPQKTSGAQLGRAAAACLRKVIRASIESAKNGAGKGFVLPRLIEMQDRDARITDDVIHAQLFGMVLGFIPTNVLAGGNMLETLLRKPEFMQRARAAALAGDDDLLWRCLRETLRFRHINPGPWRMCPEGYTIAAGSPRAVRIPPGTKVLASTQSAMFDTRRIDRPHVFDPDRRDEDYMVFGVGQHWCLGAYIARAQITHTFKPLLRMKNLKPAGDPAVLTKRFNDLFPLHLDVSFEP
jgi:cytochrome P450